MKTILCFGDSNTYGANPTGGPRFDHQTRWPGVLRHTLGPGYWVVEEGCRGRTTVWDDPIEGHKNGAAYLPPCLYSHAPIDLVVILLGTNDLKHRFGLGADDIARGAGVLVDLCQQSATGPDGGPPKVLLLAPPPLAPLTGLPFAEMFAGGEEKSRTLGRWYQMVATEKRCAFLDLAGVIVSSPTDGIHFDPPEHAKLGQAVASRVRQII
jgi:lysophospholipase L1-like esterase